MLALAAYYIIILNIKDLAQLIMCALCGCSTIQLPSSSYPLFDSLPEHTVSEGRLSQLQLEGVLYACSKHQEILPSGDLQALRKLDSTFRRLASAAGFTHCPER